MDCQASKSNRVCFHIPPSCLGRGGYVWTLRGKYFPKQELPQDHWFDQEGDWFGWVESELQSVHTNIVRMHADMENMTQNANDFMRVYQQRIDNALQDYKGAIALQFAEAESDLHETKGTLQVQFSETMHEMENKVRSEVQNMFSAQSLENGFLWQNLVNACNANFQMTLQAYMEKIAPQLDERYVAKIAQLNAVLQEKLVGSANALRVWFVKEMVGFDRSIISRMEKLEIAHAEIRATLTGVCGKQRDFESRMDKKMQTLDHVTTACMAGLRLVDQKVNHSDNSQAIADMRKNLAQVHQERVAQAHREGELKAKMEILGKRGADAVHAPPPVNPPSETPVSNPSSSGKAGQSMQGTGMANAAPLNHLVFQVEPPETPEGGGLPVPFLAQQALFSLLDDSHVSGGIREVQVCPVGIGGESNGMSFADFPIAHHLSKGVPPSTFSNKKRGLG